MFSVIFPGQGSQIVGMGKEFYEKFDVVKELFKKADDTLNFSISIGKAFFLFVELSNPHLLRSGRCHPRHDHKFLSSKVA